MTSEAPINHNEDSASENLEKCARDAADRVLRKHLLEALWAREEREIKSLLMHLAYDMADIFGRQIDSISIEDTQRAYMRAEELFRTTQIRKVRLSFLLNSVDFYRRSAPVIDIAGHAYRLGNAMVGNFAPLIRKLSLDTAGIPLGRVAGVWFAGQIIIALYWDPAGYEKTLKKEVKSEDIQGFDPLFDGLDIERLREISIYMGLDALVKWDVEKLKTEILASLKQAKHGLVSSLWSDTPTYRDILIALSSDMNIPNFQPSDSISKLEERIVHKVFAESVQKLGPEEIKELEHVATQAGRDEYWGNVARSGIKFGALSFGNLAGFNLYLAASSGLAAIGKGMGITFAFTTYTTMSTVLASVVGPLGLTVSGGYLAYQLAKPRPRKALPFVLYMAILRAHLQREEMKKVGVWRRFVNLLKIGFPKRKLNLSDPD